MYSPSIWITLLLLISAAAQSSSAKQLEKRQAETVDKCTPKPAEVADYEAWAEKIIIFLTPFHSDEECLQKGEYQYIISYAVKGEELKHLQQPANMEQISLGDLKPSTDYTIRMIPRFFYQDERRAVEGDPLIINERTRDLAPPPDPTEEIRLVDSSELNETEQAFEFPEDIFSYVNGIVKRGDILVAQDTEIDKCDDPPQSTWELAHSQSPIKCYNAGYVREVCEPSQNILQCVLGRGGCHDGRCNGALTPGVQYGLKIRGHNDAYYRDTRPVFFTAGASPAERPEDTTEAGFSTSADSSAEGIRDTTKAVSLSPGGSSTASGSFLLVGVIAFFVLLAMK